MSLTRTIVYDTPSNFSYDASLVEFLSGHVQLKKIDHPAQSYAQDFSSATGFTFSDPAEIEVAGGQLRQINQIPANATFGAQWASILDANFGGGSLVCTPFGGAVITGGKLNLTGGGYVSFDGTGNVSQIGMTGTIRFRLTLNYDGNPPDGQAFFTLGDGNNSKIQLAHLTNGNLFIIGTDTTGALGIDSTVINFPGQAGVENEIEVSWDLVTDKVYRFFANGNLFATIAADYVRAGGPDLFVGQAGAAADFFMRDLMTFDTVQHTTNYTPGYVVPTAAYVACSAALPPFTYSGVGSVQAFSAFAAGEVGSTARYILNGAYWNGSAWVTSDGSYAQAADLGAVAFNITTLPAADTLNVSVLFDNVQTQNSVDNLSVGYTGQIYPTNDPTVAPLTPIALRQLINFVAVDSAAGSDGVRFVSKANGTSYWWNGTAWAASNLSFAQANTPAQVLANFATIPGLPPGVSLVPVAVLHSASGATTPNLTSLAVTYEFYQPPPAPPPQCTLFAYPVTMLGMEFAAGQAWLQVTNQSAFEVAGTIVPALTTKVFCDADGGCQADFVITQTLGIKLLFEIGYLDTLGAPQLTTLGWAMVPNQATADVSALTFSSRADN